MLFLRLTAEARSTAMGSFRINELRRAGNIVLGEPEGGLRMEGVAAVLQAAEVSERIWIEEGPFMWWVG